MITGGVTTGSIGGDDEIVTKNKFFLFDFSVQLPELKSTETRWVVIDHTKELIRGIW